MTEGFIQLHRKMLNWEWYSDTNVTRLFIHCLLKANYKEKKWRGIVIERGQFVTSIATLAEETGLSAQSVRTCLSKLKSTSELTSKTSNKYTVISITNYCDYQMTNKQVNKQLTNNQQTTNKQLTTTNKDNKDNKEIIIEGAASSKTASPKKRGTRLSEDWDIPEEWGDWAVAECGWSVEKVVDTAKRFKDHWLSVAGSKGVKLDWYATWRNWCRRTNEGF